jgi:hypothetical protein
MQPSSYVSKPSTSRVDTAANAWRERGLLAVVLVLAGGMWLYSQWVMVPAEREYYAAKGQPMDVGDLYPRWYGARELLLHHRDPYSAEVSQEIQVVYYGHALDTAGADRGRDEQRFAYPVYVVFFLAPIVELPFPAVQAVVRWMWALLAAASVLLWLQALGWRPPTLVKLALVVLTISSPPMVQALRLQQLAVLVAFFFAACALLISRGRLFWAGCVLACATIKPQLALLPALLFLIWATGDWKRRRGLVLGFGGTLALLMAAGRAFLPGWLPEFVQGLIAYGHYVRVSSLLDFYLTPRIAKPVAITLLGILLILCFRWRKAPVEQPRFFLRFALVLAVMVVVLPLLPPFNQVFLLPGVLTSLFMWKTLWHRGRLVRAACWAGVAFTLSSWLVAGALAVTHAVAPVVTLQGVWAWPFLLSFAVPPIVTGLLLVLLQDFAIQARATAHTHIPN